MPWGAIILAWSKPDFRSARPDPSRLKCPTPGWFGTLAPLGICAWYSGCPSTALNIAIDKIITRAVISNCFIFCWSSILWSNTRRRNTWKRNLLYLTCKKRPRREDAVKNDNLTTLQDFRSGNHQELGYPRINSTSVAHPKVMHKDTAFLLLMREGKGNNCFERERKKKKKEKNWKNFEWSSGTQQAESGWFLPFLLGQMPTWIRSENFQEGWKRMAFLQIIEYR